MIYTVTIHTYGGAIVDQLVGEGWFENNKPERALYANKDFEGLGKIICIKDAKGKLWT